MTFDEKIVEIRTGLDAARSLHATEVTALKARIAVLEAQPVPPPPPPPPPPTGTAPKILVENFNAGLDLQKFYLDKDGPAGSVTVSGGQARFSWKATSDLLDMRAQMGMRLTPGSTNETPRRDPIGSTRFYAFGIFLPPEYVFDAAWGNQKCVTGQIHQGNAGGIVSPPFSLEMIKTSADGEIMRGVLALKGLITKTIIIGKPPRVESKILIHVKWSAGPDGFLKVYRDGVLTAFNHTGPTCNPRTLNGETVDDLNHMLCNYNPGRKSGSFTVGYRRDVVFTCWNIGNETNTLADMEAALA